LKAITRRQPINLPLDDAGPRKTAWTGSNVEV
jgi:hypothetical protein